MLFLCVIFSKDHNERKTGVHEEDEKDEVEFRKIDDQAPPNSIGVHEEALYLQPETDSMTLKSAPTKGTRCSCAPR